MKIKSILFAIFAIIALSSFAFAQEAKPADSGDSVKKEEGFGKRQGRHGKRGFGERKGGRHGKMGGMRGLHKLDLSDAQKEQFKALREKYKSEGGSHEEMKNLMGKRRDGIITPEEEGRLKEMMGKMKEKKMQMRQEMEAILTPEQKTRLEEMKAKMQENRKARKMRKMELKNQAPPQN